MIRFQLERLHEAAIMPSRGTPQSIGLDLHALILQEDKRPSKVMIPVRTARIISTGWRILPPQPAPTFTERSEEVYVASVWSRSGLAAKGVFVANSPGMIDPDYRGEIMVILYNGGQETYYVQHNDRVAQLVAVQCSMSQVDLVTITDSTERGQNGFGSTGR